MALGQTDTCIHSLPTESPVCKETLNHSWSTGFRMKTAAAPPLPPAPPRATHPRSVIHPGSNSEQEVKAHEGADLGWKPTCPLAPKAPSSPTSKAASLPGCRHQPGAGGWGADPAHGAFSLQVPAAPVGVPHCGCVYF